LKQANNLSLRSKKRNEKHSNSSDTEQNEEISTASIASPFFNKQPAQMPMLITVPVTGWSQIFKSFMLDVH